MKKQISIVLLFIMFSNVFYGQNNISLSNNIKISLTTGLVVNKISGDLDFGEVIVSNQRQRQTISPGDGVLFEVTGEKRKGVTVTYSTFVTLTNKDWVNIYGGDSGTLYFVPNVKRTGKNPTYTNPRNVRNGRRYRLRNDGNFGRLYIWVGGKIRVNANQPVGDYIGQFSITVAY